MTTAALLTYGANQALAALLVQKGLYLACHITDPGAAVDPATTEVASGGYERQPVRFAAASSRTTRTVTNQVFPMPLVTVRYLAVWNSAGGGNCIVAWRLDEPMTAQDDGTLVSMAGDLALSF